MKDAERGNIVVNILLCGAIVACCLTFSAATKPKEPRYCQYGKPDVSYPGSYLIEYREC